MILTCPACATRYLVDRASVSTQGRTVRCARCHHQWFARPPEDVPPPPPPSFESLLPDELVTREPQLESPSPRPRPIPEGSGLPVPHRHFATGPWVGGLVALASLLLIVTLLLQREALYPYLAPVYHAVGYYPSDGVKLADVALFEVGGEGEEHNYELECSIVNTSDQVRRVPRFDLTVTDSLGEELASERDFLKSGDAVLQPKQEYPCKDVTFHHRLALAQNVLIRIGSPLELWLRAAWVPAHES